MWECPDFFSLGEKHVLICSPQHMRARGYEFHNGHNAVYFVGSYDPEKHVFQEEKPVSLDYGLDFLCTADYFASRWSESDDRLDEILG